MKTDNCIFQKIPKAKKYKSKTEFKRFQWQKIYESKYKRFQWQKTECTDNLIGQASSSGMLLPIKRCLRDEVLIHLKKKILEG